MRATAEAARACRRLALALAVASGAGAAIPGRARAQAPVYPAARRDAVVDDYHGVKVPDPYRWLERDGAQTRAWVGAERRLTERYLTALPGRGAMRARLAALRDYARVGVPWREAGRLFWVETAGAGRQPVLYSAATPNDEPTVVLDAVTISRNGSTEVHDFAVSPDGRWLTYTASVGGGGGGETRVRSVADGVLRADIVREVMGTPCWTKDGGGFFYVRPPALRPGAAPGAARIGKELRYHLVGQPESADRLLHTWMENVRWAYCMPSDDGRRELVVAERGATQSMYVMELGDAAAPDLGAPLVPLLADHVAGYTPMGTVGDTLYVLTDLDAPRRRVIALDLRQGAAAQPWEVIPQSDDVVQGATVAGDRLALHALVDVTSRLRLYELDGRSAGEVALPGLGALGWALNGRHASPELLYSFVSFLSPETVYRLDLATGASAAFRAPRVPFDASAYETRQVFYRSKDGTSVPMFITARKAMALDGTSPAMLTAYGGFGIVTGPAYRPDLPLWLELGGIFALASPRGGGEYGEAWHRAGSGRNRQTGLDDIVAAAEYLVQAGWAARGRIAITGHSNGGMLVGAVVMQRPDLFAVAVPDAGPYDLLRFPRFTVGAGWIPEYGSPDDTADFRRLRAFSPLHNVRPRACYPAMLLLTADHDDTVVPAHSYKFAAALQAAQGCGRPILLRVATLASHMYASEAAEVAERADVWAFTAARLGVP